MIISSFPPPPPAGVRADPAGGPGAEGDPSAGPGRWGLLGERPAAGGDLHPPQEAGPGSALGGLAPTGRGWHRPYPLTSRRRLKTKGKPFQSKSLMANPPSAVECGVMGGMS